MFDSQQLSLNTFTFSQSYISPSPAASPLTLFDAHEMADLIRGTMRRTGVAIAANIAAHIETANMSGRDFLNLSRTDLQTLSNNNEQVFRELAKLQQIPHGAMTYVSARSPSIERGFPQLASLIHNRRLPSSPDSGANSMGIGNVIDCLHNDSSSSAMLGQQFLEESFSHEAFDFSDDEEVTPDLHSTAPIVNEVPPLPASSPQAADLGIAVPQNDPSPPDRLTHPGTSVDPAQEDEPLLASSTSSNLADRLGQGNSNPLEPGLMNGNTPQNDLTTTTITFATNIHAYPATTSAVDGATHILVTEKVHNAVLQPVQDEPIPPTMTFPADEASINPLDPQSASGPKRDITPLQSDPVLAGPDLPAHYHSLPESRSTSPTLSYVDEDPDAATQLSEIPLDDNVPNPSTPADPNILLEEGRLPISSIHCGPITELPSRSNSDSLEGSQLENSSTPSLDHPQPLINSHALIVEDKEAPEPPRLPASEPVAILSASPCGVVYNTLNPPPFSEFLHAPDLNPDNSINDTCFDVGEASKGQTYETPQSSDTSEGVDHAVNETDPESPRHLNISSEDPHDSLTSNGTHEPIESCRSSPQPLPSSLTSSLEPTTVLSLTSPRSGDADIQSTAAPTDENLEGSLVDVSSNLSPLAHPSDLARLEVPHDLDIDSVPQSDLNERSNIDTSSHGNAITFPFNTLPPIPVTPSDSPVLEGLYQYITAYDPDAPLIISQENVGVDLDRASTPVQREMHAREHTSQLDRCCRHLFHRDSYLGMSNRGPSSFRHMQLGVWNVIPTSFALDRETMKRVTSC